MLVLLVRNGTYAGMPVEEKVKALSDLGKVLRYSNPKEARAACEKAIGLSRLLEDKQYASYAWSAMFAACHRERDSVQRKALDSTLFYAEQSGDPVLLGNAYYMLSNKREYGHLLKAINFLQDSSGNNSLIDNEEKNLLLARTCYDLVCYGWLKREPELSEK